MNGVNSTYTYRPDGLRGTKSVNGTLTRHIWDGDEVSAELNADSSVKRTFTHGYAPATCYEGNDHYAFIRDRHGDVIKTVECFTESVIEEYTYDAYGNQRDLDSPFYTSDTNPYRYSGEYYDYETGFIYLRARYYDSTTGTFISEDPARDGANWYTYCAGNPVMFVDPWGLAVFLGSDSDEADNFVAAMQSYTDIELTKVPYVDPDTGEVKYYLAKANIFDKGSHTTGNKLFMDLIKSPHAVHIRFMTEAEENDPKNGPGGFTSYNPASARTYGMGSGGVIAISNVFRTQIWADEGEFTVQEKDGSIRQQKASFGSTILHELIHAWHATKGLMRRAEIPKGYSVKVDNGLDYYKESMAPEEAVAIGLDYTMYNQDGKIIESSCCSLYNIIDENKIREEMGLPKRLTH